MSERTACIVITGAASGLGFSIAQELVACGYALVITSRSLEKATLAARQLQQSGGSVRGFALHTNDVDSVNQFIRQLEEEGLQPRALINNASGWFSGGLDATPPQMVQEVVEGTLTGTAMVTQALIPLLTRCRGAQVITLLSTAGTEYAFSTNTVYYATKAGAAGLMRAMRREYDVTGIRFVSFHFGQVAEHLEAPHPPRLLDPADVARSLAWLLAQPAHVSVDSLVLTPRELSY